MFSKKKSKSRKRRVFLIISAILLTIFLCVIIAAPFLSKNKDYLNEKTFYFVYVDSGQKQIELAIQSERVSSLGGAGKIMSHANNYYLVASVYLTQSEANEIYKNIQSNFPNSGILKITKKLTRSQKRKIKTNDSSVLAFKMINKTITELQASAMQYLSGKISESALCTNVLGKKIELEVLIKDFVRDSESSKKVLDFENLWLLYVTNFCDNFFTSTKKQSILTQLIVNLVLAECDLIDNL